jgi:hypothetical protein
MHGIIVIVQPGFGHSCLQMMSAAISLNFQPVDDNQDHFMIMTNTIHTLKW